jgi:drug/metabolite transporter (DMT)-like permease
VGLSGPERRWIGPLCAVVGVLGFSFKAILIKLAYSWHPVDAVTLLALRMIFSAPFFIAMAWWAGRKPDAPPIAKADWLRLSWLGFIGYYLASLLDFMGLAYITASLERLVLFLYPTMVVLLSAVLRGRPITRRAVVALVVSYAGIAFVFINDLSFAGDKSATLLGGALVFASAFLYALYLIDAGAVIARLGSLRFIAWAMLVSSVFVLGHFALTRDIALLHVPASIYALSLAMAIFSTVLPTWLIAVAIHRIGASTSSLIGSLGPVFTIGLGALILGEAVQGVQLFGAALVLAGVMRVTLQPRSSKRDAAAPAPELPDT